MRLISFWKDDKGVYGVVAALTMPVLLSGAVLATEVGMWAVRHEQMCKAPLTRPPRRP